MNRTYKTGLFSCLLILSLACSIQKKSSTGQKELIAFSQNLGDKGNSYGVTVEEISTGGYLLTGYTTGGEYGEEDLLLIKTNEAGEVMWRKTYGGEGKDYGWAVRETGEGYYIITGYTNSFGNGGMDVYLIKTDTAGNTLWTKTYGGTGEEFGWDIRTTKDGGFIIAAQTNSIGNGEIDAYLIKLDQEGNEEWSESYGGNKIDRIFSVYQTQEGGYIAAGISYSYTSINADDRDGYLLKTDPTGKEEWYKTIGKDGYDVAHAIALCKDGGYFITGYGESYASTRNRDVYLIKTDAKGENQWFKVYGGRGEERGIKGYQTRDGGYVAVGFTAENRNMYLLRTNHQGDTLWTRTYGEVDKMDFGYTVRETKDKGFIITGNSRDLQNGKTEVRLIKTDKDGRLVQQH